jgi:hypothetical protein
VLAFTGGLAFLVFQNGGSNSISISQITEQYPANSQPYFGSESGASNTNANAAVPSANMAANIAEMTIDEQGDVKTQTAGKEVVANTVPDTARTQPLQEKMATVTDSTAAGSSQPQPVTAAPPAPPEMLDGVKAGEDKNKDADESKAEVRDLELSKRREVDDRRGYRRDAPPPASKAGPSRAGPLQNQSNQVNNQAYEMSVTRRVGGKSFNNRDGVWYDTAYSGQATTNYRRSSVDYKSLDASVRNIANDLGGTVVIVWKGKAYRIQ